MTEYLVTWSMPIEASSPIEAAKQALTIQRDPESIATVFYAEADSEPGRWRVDLHYNRTEFEASP